MKATKLEIRVLRQEAEERSQNKYFYKYEMLPSTTSVTCLRGNRDLVGNTSE
ncbi:hypothetical protein QUA54_07215 [Microcoleus sp. MOSTC5]|uniref:hypothetical protein n=1 Tax=Microcoleus sp. MOSTC5 TaxID=3055378 RepID=UPI002FD09053